MAAGRESNRYSEYCCPVLRLTEWNQIQPVLSLATTKASVNNWK